MQCKELEAVLEQEGLSPLPIEAREHLAECPACQNFLADLSAIVVAAKQFPAEAAPPDRIWISLRAQLAAEGVIKELQPAAVLEDSPWWNNLSALFRPRTLAAVGAGVLLLAGSLYLTEHFGQPQSGTAKVDKPQMAQEAPNPATPSLRKPIENAPAKHPGVPPANQVVDKTPAEPTDLAAPALKPSPSENAFGDSAIVLSQTESDVQGMRPAGSLRVDAALRENLRTLNEFIAECEQHLKQNPQDQLARDYLNSAYQQKAELLAAMIDSGRSEH